jgi:hypothetical protein
MSKQYKEIVLGAAVVLLGAISWWFLKYIFYTGNLTISCWIMGGIIFVLWGIALCLAMLLIKDRKILYGSFLLCVGAFGAFFNNEPFYYLVALALLFWAFVVASSKIQTEEMVQMKLNFWRIWKRGLPIFITFLCVLIALVYYFSPELAKIEKKEIVVPRKTFDMVIRPLETLIIERLPEGISSIDTEAKQILKPQEIEELKEKYNIEVKEGETIKDLIYQLMQYQINTSSGPYEKFIPIGLAVGLFLALKLFGFFYIAIIILLSWLVLRLLVVLGFASIGKEMREMESVKL